MTVRRWSKTSPSGRSLPWRSGEWRERHRPLLTRLLPEPPAEISTAISFFAANMFSRWIKHSRHPWRRYRLHLSEPSTPLNPVYTIRSQIAEAIQLHRPEVKISTPRFRCLTAVGIVNPGSACLITASLRGCSSAIAGPVAGPPVADELTTARRHHPGANPRRAQAAACRVWHGLILITHNIAVMVPLTGRDVPRQS
jgi:ABC-type dipeptide/oligopeptide/nickel transport system ATPase component